MIYTNVFTVDQVFEGEDEGIYQGYGKVSSYLRKFNINRQIREEAWDHLVDSNVWIQVTMTEQSPLVDHFRFSAAWYPYLTFPSNRAPLEARRRLAAKVAIGFAMGDPWVKRWRNGRVDHHIEHRMDNRKDAPLVSVIFAYHTLTYGAFISALARDPHGFTVGPSQPTLACPQKFNKLLAPLCLLRAGGAGRISGVDRTVLQPIQKAMNQHWCKHESVVTIVEMVKDRAWYQNQGRTAEHRGRYSDAMCYYWLGSTEERAPSDAFAEGSPEYNTLSACDTDLRIGVSRCAHRHVANAKRSAAPVEIDYTHLAWVARQGAEAAGEAMARFVGLTDEQRREAHLYSAFNYLHQGKHLDAAHDLFYAQQVDPSYDIPESFVDEEDRVAYEQVKKHLGRKAFELAEHDIPLLDSPWKGDPDLWLAWNRHHRFLMKQFQQRYDQGPDGPEDLAPRYALQGITWTFDDDGKLITSVSRVPGN